jgi:hypothetical protein
VEQIPEEKRVYVDESGINSDLKREGNTGGRGAEQRRKTAGADGNFTALMLWRGKYMITAE